MSKRNPEQPQNHEHELLTVRPLDITDLPSVRSILELWVRKSPEGPPITHEVNQFINTMRGSLEGGNDGQYYVASSIEGRILGVVGRKSPDATMQAFTTTLKPTELVNMYSVEPGKGVGRKLVRHLEKVAKQEGYTEVLLNSGPRYKDTAWNFYDRMGYQRVGIIQNAYGEGRHAPVWRKIL